MKKGRIYLVMFMVMMVLVACSNNSSGKMPVTEDEEQKNNSESSSIPEPTITEENTEKQKVDEPEGIEANLNTPTPTIDPSNPYSSWSGEWFAANGETISFHAYKEDDMEYEYYLADGSEYYCGDFEGVMSEASVKFETSIGEASSSLFTFDGDELIVEKWYKNVLTFEDVYEGANTFYRVGTHSEIEVVADPNSATNVGIPVKTEIKIGSEYDGYYIISDIDLTSNEISDGVFYYISSSDYGEDSYFVGKIRARYNSEDKSWNSRGEFDLKNDGSVSYAEGNIVRAKLHPNNYIGYTETELVFNGENLTVTSTTIDGTVMVEEYVKYNGTFTY